MAKHFLGFKICADHILKLRTVANVMGHICTTVRSNSNVEVQEQKCCFVHKCQTDIRQLSERFERFIYKQDGTDI